MTSVNVMKCDSEMIRKENAPPTKSSSYELCEDIINELIQMRHSNHISQYQLAARSGVKQPMIYRIENGINTPNMSTVLKLLAAYGKTLYIGDMKKVELEDGAEQTAGNVESTELPDENLPTE
ncbi:MAG: helix-turn-helix transcriptional regulator [Ruminococcaceae bacterium]|nr:helix-turn-helix transcriptional regulator [Oscillospiraceae bacterium]